MNPKAANPTPVETQDQTSSGHIDVSLVEHLLTLSFEERLDAHENARELVNDLMQAGQSYYARQSKTSP
jgi:hypothetical protein